VSMGAVWALYRLGEYDAVLRRARSRAAIAQSAASSLSTVMRECSICVCSAHFDNELAVESSTAEPSVIRRIKGASSKVLTAFRPTATSNTSNKLLGIFRRLLVTSCVRMPRTASPFATVAGRGAR
jgi:hypothetical protein